jgi:hypothetical protein
MYACQNYIYEIIVMIQNNLTNLEVYMGVYTVIILKTNYFLINKHALSINTIASVKSATIRTS